MRYRSSGFSESKGFSMPSMPNIIWIVGLIVFLPVIMNVSKMLKSLTGAGAKFFGLMDDEKEKAVAETANKEIVAPVIKTIKKSNLTFNEGWYKAQADRIHDSFNGLGTDESVLQDVLGLIKTYDDATMLWAQYGYRINSGYSTDLVQAVIDELDLSNFTVPFYMIVGFGSNNLALGKLFYKKFELSHPTTNIQRMPYSVKK